MTNPRRKKPAGSFHEENEALSELSSLSEFPGSGGKHMKSLRGVKGFVLDELPDPPADVVSDYRHAHTDHEHVQA